MAPEIALRRLRRLRRRSVVLDPMAGSGTVLRQAALLGHHAIGFDLDPLAVLLSSVASNPLVGRTLTESALAIVSYAQTLNLRSSRLPWIDEDDETRKFVEYWFASRQRKDLRRLAHAIHEFEQHSSNRTVQRALKVALSKLIITKQSGASLAWDVSHSRPHKVRSKNHFDVLQEFLRACQDLESKLCFPNSSLGTSEVRRGDARKLRTVSDRSIDAIVTSPPYLNAIDYLRGHRLALVWLGYSLQRLRRIRAKSIGTECAYLGGNHGTTRLVVRSIVKEGLLPERFENIVSRYAVDLILVTREFARVIRPGGTIDVVVGNSNLKGVYIDNAAGFRTAARLAGLKYCGRTKRELPLRLRYLPVPDGKSESLGRRIRHEYVLSFQR